MYKFKGPLSGDIMFTLERALDLLPLDTCLTKTILLKDI